MNRPLRRLAIAAAAVTAATVLVGPQPAQADTGVTIVKILNAAYDGIEGNFPVTLTPHYRKSGPVVIDSAVITVRDNETGVLIGAGRTYVKVEPGEYKVTTTVRYRTFTNVGYTTKVVAETGDIVPAGASLFTSRLFLSVCSISTLNLTDDDADEHPSRSGTFSARCTARWGTSTNSSETGWTNVYGVARAAWDPGNDRYVYQFQIGDTWHDIGTETAVSTSASSFNAISAPASHDITHAFPVRKYSTQKVERATHIVRQIIR
jgi:hypothetical protein